VISELSGILIIVGVVIGFILVIIGMIIYNKCIRKRVNRNSWWRKIDSNDIPYNV
jgi:H+/gluconate symporter-like permease